MRQKRLNEESDYMLSPYGLFSASTNDAEGQYSIYCGGLGLSYLSIRSQHYARWKHFVAVEQDIVEGICCANCRKRVKALPRVAHRLKYFGCWQEKG